VIIRVVPHDASWARSFDTEARRIADAVGDVVVRLHHIGSTAITGIRAKPIIDILMEVSELSELDRRTSQLEALGYEAMGEFGSPGRRYFRREDQAGTRTHQVHAFLAGSDGVDRHLAFRDYMIAYPQVAQLYGELKQRLAEQFPNDIHAYMDGKDSFIKDHQAKALSWRANRITTGCSGR
jgi:GrpB-like predicted nucleotidyltransferase (UPF0157 family)